MIDTKDPVNPLVREETRYAVVDASARGERVAATCERLGIKPSTYYSILRDAAEKVRDSTRELCEIRFMQHDERLEYMYSQLQDRLDAFDPERDTVAGYAALIRAAIAILERSAKMWGTDREKPQGGRGFADWLDDASPTELVRIAETYGIEIPKPFVTAVETAK